MNRRALLAAVVVGAGLTAVATVTAVRPSARGIRALPSYEDAVALLQDTYTAARRLPDAATFCASSAYEGICIDHYAHQGGRPAVPTSPPTIQRGRVQDRIQILTVCGTDGRGMPYKADFPVTRDDGRLVAMLDVFWYSTTFSGSYTTDPGHTIAPVQSDPTSTAC